jgi:hypothetical protein
MADVRCRQVNAKLASVNGIIFAKNQKYEHGGRLKDKINN